jgi:radical SAM superfamily enzyme YgiQ (UPF0313 family)
VALVRALLVSTYELGHQPLHVASPAAALRAAGHEVACLDLAVSDFDEELVAWAEVVAFSVPMHTAMRLAMRAAERVKQAHPTTPVCLYGLYAPVSRDLTVGRLADRIIAGEYEPALVAWVDGLDSHAETTKDDHGLIQLGRSPFRLPARDLLPPLTSYARLAVGEERRLVGYVEASHGCAHQCRHCPVPTVYGGRVRLVGRDVVLDDIAELVEAGAAHITFGDPDFLNGWRHSQRLVEAMHDRFPWLTYDVTVKVDHILNHEWLWPTLAATGCAFVVCALESTDDDVLARLDKGHTTAMAREAIALLRRHGIEMRPSLLPFTPWTTAADVVEMLDFVADHDLVDNIDPVMYTIRLLLPEGSLLLDHPDVAPYLGPYDPERLTYTWTGVDPAAERLQAHLAELVESSVAAREPTETTFDKVRAAALEAAGQPPSRRDPVPAGARPGSPRLTEPWFC